MLEKERYLTNNIVEDLNEKMVFIGGARQVGKTTLARKIIASKFPNFTYYNWDYQPDRNKITKLELPGEEGLLIFDEIHKYNRWKNYIKGIYDTHKEKFKIVVTGSSRLNIFRRGGDSLQGRYHYYTLFPFTLAELENIGNKFELMGELQFSNINLRNQFELLYEFGGFPEVAIKQNKRSLRRWHNEKLERLFNEDVRDLENIRDIGNMKLLGDMLPDKAAGPLSINAIREDLEISHRAVTNWLSVLELFYYIVRIFPFHSRKIRSIKKEPKIYLTDWSEVRNEGAKFENMIAIHLLKFITYLKEYEGYNIELNYLRNVDKKEVDFLISINNKPWFAVEAKLNDLSPSPNTIYFKERLKIPLIFQVVKKENIDVDKNGIRIISASKFLSGLI